MIVAKRTVLRAGMEREYERVHASPPEAVIAALRAVGVREWRIWRSGRELFHTIDVDDRARMTELASRHPILIEWNARIDDLLEPVPPTGNMDFSPVWTMS